MPKVPQVTPSSVTSITPALRPVAAQTAAEVNAIEGAFSTGLAGSKRLENVAAEALETAKQDRLRIERDALNERNENARIAEREAAAKAAADTAETKRLRIQAESDERARVRKEIREAEKRANALARHENTLARNSAVQQFHVKSNEALLSQAFPDPDQYMDAASGIISALAGDPSLDPNVAELLSVELQGLAEKTRFGIAQKKDTALTSAAFESIQGAVDGIAKSYVHAETFDEQLALRQQALTIIADGEDSNLLDVKQAAGMRHNFINSAAASIIASVGAENPVGALFRLNDKDDPGLEGMDPGLRESAIAKMEKKVWEQQGILRAHEEAKLDAMIRVVGPDTLEELSIEAAKQFAKGHFTKPQYLSKLAAIANNIGTYEIDSGLRVDITRAAAGDGTWNQSAPGAKRVLNQWFGQKYGDLLEKAAGNTRATNEVHNMMAVDMANLGEVPTELAGRWQQTLRSGTNAQAIISTVEQIHKLVGISPRTVSDTLSEEQLNVYYMVRSKVQNGLSPDTAVTDVMAQLREAPGRADELSRRFEATFKGSGRKDRLAWFNKEIDEEMGSKSGFFFDEADDFDPNMVPEGLALYRGHYLNTADEDAALKHAMLNLRSTYKVSTIGQGGKKRWVRTPADQMYEVPGIPGEAWIPEQLKGRVDRLFQDEKLPLPPDVLAQFTDDERELFAAEGVPVDRILLETDSFSERETPGNISYVVKIRSDNGLHVMLRLPGSHEHFTFRPNYAKSPHAARVEAARVESALSPEEVELDKARKGKARKSRRAANFDPAGHRRGEMARGTDGPTAAMSEQPQQAAAAAVTGALQAQSEDYGYTSAPSHLFAEPGIARMGQEDQFGAIEGYLMRTHTQEELDAAWNLYSAPLLGRPGLQSMEGRPGYRHHSVPER